MQGVRSAMYPRNLFVYCSYWGTWSRVLRYMQRDNDGQVELNLTTPNVHYAPEWEKNKQLWIRKHCTSRDSKDVYAAELPTEALELMRLYLDEATIRRLLHEDILPLIDFDKYRAVCNGGASLASIMKDQHV